jgi:hypothetical protein
MPFSSKAQMGYMFANHPDIAKRWQKEAPVDYGKLPERKTASKGTKKLLSGKKD